MLSKEWRDARWKLLVVTFLVLLSVPYTTPLEVTAREATADGLDVAVFELYEFYTYGGIPLALLAAVLGAGVISSERSRETILLLLSKPISRKRILLAKYTVCAGALLAATVIGHALLLAVAAKSYPLEALSPVGVILATLLLWLGSLFVLGLAAILSVLFRNALAVFAVTAVILYQLGIIPSYVGAFMLYTGFGSRELRGNTMYVLADDRLVLYDYWVDSSLYSGQSLATTDFLVCATAAAIPLILALRLFERRAY